MKHRILLISLALSLLCSVGATAQNEAFDWGIKAGANLNFMPWTSIEPLDREIANVGFYGGGFVSINLSDRMFCQAELMYTRKGVSTRNELQGDYCRNISYIELPLLIGWDILGDDTWKLMTGPAVAYCVGQKQTYSTAVPPPTGLSDVNPFNLSWVVEGNYAITDSLIAELRFDISATRVFKAGSSAISDEGRNATASLGLCYRFGY